MNNINNNNNMQALGAEIEAHLDVLHSIQEMGIRLAHDLDDARDREDLQNRLQRVKAHWSHLNQKSSDIK